MPGPISLEVKYKKLPTDILNKVASVFGREASHADRSAAVSFVTAMQNYPPEGAGNAPPHPFWERGVGRVMASGNISPPSQHFGDSWTTEEVNAPFQNSVVVKNPTTYAKYLIDDNLQTTFHKRAGWRTISQVANSLGITARAYEASGPVREVVRKIENFIKNLF